MSGAGKDPYLGFLLSGRKPGTKTGKAKYGKELSAALFMKKPCFRSMNWYCFYFRNEKVDEF